MRSNMTHLSGECGRTSSRCISSKTFLPLSGLTGVIPSSGKARNGVGLSAPGKRRPKDENTPWRYSSRSCCNTWAKRRLTLERVRRLPPSRCLKMTTKSSLGRGMSGAIADVEWGGRMIYSVALGTARRYSGRRRTDGACLRDAGCCGMQGCQSGDGEKNSFVQ